MLATAAFSLALLASPRAMEVQPIGDSIRRATNETEKFYGRQWQMSGETMRVALVRPGEWLRFSGTFTTETVHFVAAGQNNTSKIEMNIVDPETKKILEKAEQDSLGGIYFMPKKGKAYMIEVLNGGKVDDFITVIQVVGGLGAQLPLSSFKFLASSTGHALYDMAKSGEATLPTNTPFLRVAVVPPKGTFISPIALSKPKSQIIAFGDEGTEKIKSEILDGANKVIGRLEDEGAGASEISLPNGLSNAKRIRFTNPTSKRLVYSWAVFTGK